MSQKSFQFKEFTLFQDRCAMKVGTDGVLLGAWINIDKNTSSILDIGTGTGLIALQLAQRSDAPLIDGLEIEDNAFEQAVENFENSPWADRLFCYHSSIQEFALEIEDKYDLIVSNPPFYNDTFHGPEPQRALARHTLGLSYEELLSSTAKLLSPNGSCAFILPYKEESKFLSIASGFQLKPVRITRVRGHQKSELKRSLIQLNKNQNDTSIEELTIEQQRHVYTTQYTDLVKDFYLKI